MTPSPDELSSAPGATRTPAPPPQCPAHEWHGKERLINLLTPEAVADPMTAYEQLRAEHGPVAPVLVGDLPAWLVLGYRENLEVARTASRFTRDSRVWNLAREARVPADSPLRPFTDWKPIVRFAEGEEHRRLRSAINDSVARLNRRGIRRHVTRYADGLIDTFCGDGRADLVTQFTQHLPMLVMTRLLGMPDHAGPALVEATQSHMGGTKNANAGNEYIMKTLREVVTEKRARPGNDIASWLLGHPAGLSDVEVSQNLRVILVMQEPTASLTASTLRMVLTDPRLRASLAGGHMTLPDAVDQMLWDEPPMRTLVARWAVADTEVGGQKIKAGDLMLMGLGAANVDPAIRPDLAASLLGNRSHLAFGGGAHECPGQDLSRAIVETGVDTLLTRLPDLSLAVREDELRWDSAWVTRHLTTLPVTFAPKSPSASRRPATWPSARSLITEAVAKPAASRTGKGAGREEGVALHPADPVSGASLRAWLRRLLRRSADT